MTKLTSLLITALIMWVHSYSQPVVTEQRLTLQDSLRGSITPERAWWNVTKYEITVQPDFNSKTIKGSNNITFNTTADGNRMQIDLQEPMQITRVIMDSKDIKFTRNGNVYYVEMNDTILRGKTKTIRIHFSGKPREAVTPPWDGGWIWRTDSYGDPWMSVACQGIGASVWYPCKDHQSDEPDSASLTMIVPDTLIAVGNGRLRSMEKKNGKAVFTWAVVNPINNYAIVPYIGKYVNWSEQFTGEKGQLSINYWVLHENLQAAKRQFTQVPEMLKCFEHWFGPYPFYEDGYQLVESPHLGMEHQSAIAYGNGFSNGYLGNDLSGSGWGDKWDFIIVHESAHEWFANSITTKDIADMWVHEGFTNYSEVLFTTCKYGVKAGNEYAIGLRRNIKNDTPVIGTYGVNREGSIDMYYKGANLVHMIRQIMDDDKKFRLMLRDMNKKYYHQTVTSTEIEKYISDKVGMDLSKMFDQYLRRSNIPRFEFAISGGKLRYRWSNCVDGFNMPLKVTSGDKTFWIQPSTTWKEMKVAGNTLTVDQNFYIASTRI